MIIATKPVKNLFLISASPRNMSAQGQITLHEMIDNNGQFTYKTAVCLDILAYVGHNDQPKILKPSSMNDCEITQMPD